MNNLCNRQGRFLLPIGNRPCRSTARNIELLRSSMRAIRPRTGLNHVQLPEIFAFTPDEPYSFPPACIIIDSLYNTISE